MFGCVTSGSEDGTEATRKRRPIEERIDVKRKRVN
jgi:hypothetical protein